MAIGVGVAVAGGELGSDGDRHAFLDNAAKRLGTTPAQLEAALQAAYADRLDAAVAAGRITKSRLTR
jgi:predicted nuclease of restriction endonuclease-like RecB superfamily